MDRLNRKLEELESQVHGLLEIPKPPLLPYHRCIRKGMQKRVGLVKALLAAEKSSHTDPESKEHKSIEHASARLTALEDAFAGWAGSEPSLCFDSCLNGDAREEEEEEGEGSSSDTCNDNTVAKSKEVVTKKRSSCRFFSGMVVACATVAVIAVAITRFSGMEELASSLAT